MKSGKVQRFRKGWKDSKNWNSKDARKIEKAWILNDRRIVDNILEIGDPKIQRFKKRIEGIRLAKMRKVLDCGGVSSKD